MEKTEHPDKFGELVDSVLKTDLDTSVFANILGVSESDLDFLSTADKRNEVREENYISLVESERLTENYFKNSSIREAIKDFHESNESISVRQRILKISVELKMLMKGLRNPKQILELLAQNTAVHTFYDIDFIKLKPKIKSFHYDRISSEFMGFIAEFDNPTLLLDRLNKLRVNVSLHNIDIQREKAKDLLNIICQISEEHFQKAVTDLNQFDLLGSCDIIQSNDQSSDKSLNKDFITRLRVIEKGGFTDEEKEIYKTFNDDLVICPSIRDHYGLETLLDNKELLKSLHVVLSEEVRQLLRADLPRETSVKVKTLEDKGVLTKLSTIFSSGIIFSRRENYGYINTRSILNSIILESEYSEKTDVADLIDLIELTYDNLTNKEFILMRSFLGIYTIEDSNVVNEALQKFKLTKNTIEALSTEEKKKLFKSLRSNYGYAASVPDSIAEIWKKWLTQYDGVVDGGRKKITNILLGILKLDDDLTKSQLESAIKQQQNQRSAVDERVRTAVSSIDYREAKYCKAGSKEFLMFPIDTVRIDKDHVIDQNMDVIQLSENQVRVQLFLTNEAWTDALNVLKQDSDDPKISLSEIRYSYKKVVDAVCYQPIDGLTISIASNPDIRATNGLVDIQVDLTKVDKDTYLQEIDSTLSYLIGLSSEENLLSPTDEKSDEVLIEELYKLNTKNDNPPSDVKFERRVVMDGYETVVIPDRHKILREKHGSFVTYHKIYDSYNLLNVLTNGVRSSHQRYRQGMLIEGMSTDDDFRRGGANSVFTRTFSVDSLIDEDTIWNIFYSTNLIFSPEIWDRLDFYIYDQDCFGDTSDKFLNLRSSPDEYLSNLLGRKYDKQDEQMFRRGIPPEMIKGVMIHGINEKNHIIKELLAAGISSINGKSLDNFIYANTRTDDDIFAAVDIAEGLPIGTTKKSKIKEKSHEEDE